MSKKKDQEEVSEGSQNASAPGVKPGTGDESSKGGRRLGAGEAGAGTSAPQEEQQDSGAPRGGADDRVAGLETEVADLKDKLLRKQADFENYRKRMLREREDASRYSNAALLSDIIGLIDDFERAIKSAEESNDFPTFLQGVSMIEKQFIEMLESRWGLKRFSSVGEGFDPNRHEAVLRVEGPVNSKPVVVEDFQKGYFLHERVLRPARVKVMVPRVDPTPAQPGDGDSGAEGQDENARAGT
jgi:molecular chaperone GrpE